MTGLKWFDVLNLSALGKFFSRRHIEIFFLIFPRKQELAFHSNCLHCIKCQNLFSWKENRKNINLSSTELAQRVVKVKDIGYVLEDPIFLISCIIWWISYGLHSSRWEGFQDKYVFFFWFRYKTYVVGILAYPLGFGLGVNILHGNVNVNVMGFGLGGWEGGGGGGGTYYQKGRDPYSFADTIETPFQIEVRRKYTPLSQKWILL